MFLIKCLIVVIIISYFPNLLEWSSSLLQYEAGYTIGQLLHHNLSKWFQTQIVQ